MNANVFLDQHPVTERTAHFKPAARIQQSLLAPLERRALAWLAAHTPGWINSDHLTLLGLLSMLVAGLCYWAARWEPMFLFGVVLCLALNWLGDSLDGTLARFRNRQRPRYGFYVDHVVDIFSTLFLLCGLALSGYMSPLVAAALLVAYLMIFVEVALATYTLGKFRISYGLFSPTELRVVLAIGTLFLLRRPMVSIAGERYQLFDVGGVIAVAGIMVVLVITSIAHTRELYNQERLD